MEATPAHSSIPSMTVVSLLSADSKTETDRLMVANITIIFNDSFHHMDS